MGKRILFSVILVLVIFFGWNAYRTEDKEIVYQVEASGGGPNGFNSVVCRCDDVNKIYKGTFTEPGNSKYETCCISKLPKEVLKLVAECEKLISMHKNTSGEINSKKYKLNYNIQNSMNFKYEIRRVSKENTEE